MKPTTIYLKEEDREAIKRIRERYGLTSNAAAVRLALRLTAAAEGLRYEKKR